MSEQTPVTSAPPVRNKAQEDRSADPTDVKRITDTPDNGGGETWEAPTGHSGTRKAWIIALSMVTTFLLGGVGMTTGPRILLWVGAGLFIALALYSLAAHTWSDYTHGASTSPEPR